MPQPQEVRRYFAASPPKAGSVLRALSDDDVKKIADKIAGHGLNVGSLVAPVWPGTVGDSAMGSPEQREKFAGLDCEAHVVDGGEVTEASGDTLDFE
jgi:hypothetical protein